MFCSNSWIRIIYATTYYLVVQENYLEMFREACWYSCSIKHGFLTGNDNVPCTYLHQFDIYSGIFIEKLALL